MRREPFDTALPGMLTVMGATGVVVWGAIITLLVWSVL
jgi:hypothetical protein